MLLPFHSRCSVSMNCSSAKHFLFLNNSWWNRGNSASLQMDRFAWIGVSAWRMARGNRLTPAQRLAWHRQPGWSQLGAIPFPFPLGSVCAHGELLLLSCHCCFIIITRFLSQSPVPNLALGNASSWEVSSVLCMAYLLRMQWKGTSRWWQSCGRGTHQVSTGVLALQGDRVTLRGRAVQLLFY